MTGEQLAVDLDRYGALDAICENGLRLWQNYVIERKDFSKKVVATIMQQGSTVDPLREFRGREALPSRRTAAA